MNTDNLYHDLHTPISVERNAKFKLDFLWFTGEKGLCNFSGDVS